MNTRAARLAAAGSALLLAGACVQKTPPDVPTPPAESSASRPAAPATSDSAVADGRTLTLVYRDGDPEPRRAVELAPGTQLVVRLASNPTTGYRWQLTGVPAVLASEGEAVYEPSPRVESEPLRTGAGGTEVFTFRAARAGSGSLAFRYLRPWETGVTPARTLDVEIRVSAN